VDGLMQRLEAGEGRAVEPELQALLKKHPRYHMSHFAMGVYLGLVMKDAEGSLPFFERAVQIFPPFPEAHYNLGNSARRMGAIPKAVKAYRAAMRYAQADDPVAELAAKELKFLETIVLKDSPFANLDAYVANAKLFDEAYACLAHRDYEQAVRLFNQVLAENPRHVQSFGNLALAQAGLGRRAAALECLDKALALDPRYEPASTNRVRIEQMREGEPFNPAAIQEIHFYSELVKRGG